MIDPKKIREDFPMFSNKVRMQGQPLVFLDNASTTFKPKQVVEAIEKYYTEETSNSHRGDYDLCYNADKRIDETRATVARFINADKKECVFTSGATMSVNLVAYGYALKHLKKGDEILLSVAEHASNTLPWFRVAELTGATISYIELNKEGRITLDNVKKALNEKTKIVAIAQIGNVLGYLADIKSIAKLAHEKGAIMVCDGAQSVPHMKTDVKDLDVDFLSFSGHKMCGPTGIGVLYGKYELLQKMDPVFAGGGMNVYFHSNQDVKYLDAPERFEVGTLNLEGIFGLKAAIEYIEKIGIENIAEYEKKGAKYFTFPANCLNLPKE